MDNSDNPRSKIPVSVKIVSEREPVDCDGYFIESENGFVLEFGTPSGKYIITHTAEKTRLSTSGLLSYDLDFTDGGATEVITPLGGLDFSMTPVKREVAVDGDGARLELMYKLCGAGMETMREVIVTARFLR